MQELREKNSINHKKRFNYFQMWTNFMSVTLLNADQTLSGLI